MLIYAHMMRMYPILPSVDHQLPTGALNSNSNSNSNNNYSSNSNGNYNSNSS